MENKKGFVCANCSMFVSTVQLLGTQHRNHCPYCLWSKHVDEKVSGDRRSKCFGLMKPIGLEFKDEGVDKYGKKRQGEIVIIHECQKCGRMTKNRIAGDDNAEEILNLVKKDQAEEVKIQLFGKR